MAQRTQVFSLDNPQTLILDLCMAPGGFTKSVRKRFPHANVHAITLPPDSGDHQVIVQDPKLNRRLTSSRCLILFSVHVGECFDARLSED